MRIIFMGSPAFAIPTLEALIASSHEVVAVYTQPPRPSGRGQEETPTPVHQLAKRHGIPVEIVTSLKTDEAYDQFNSFKADVAVVCAYGLILPQKILDACQYGCLNIHPSELPRWRGASPLQHTLLAGDTTSVMSIMQMDKGMDTGEIISSKLYQVRDGLTITELHDDMALMGASELLLALATLKSDGKLDSRPQSSEGITYTTKITKQMGRIRWEEPALVTERKIRALTPWPGVFSSHKGEYIKILSADVLEDNTTHPYAKPGEVVSIDPLIIATGSGLLLPTMLQRAGKKAMKPEEFLRGYEIKMGDSFI